MWYESSCSGTTASTGVSSGCDFGIVIRKSFFGSSRSWIPWLSSVVKAMTEPNPSCYLWAPRLRQRLGSIGERIIANAKAEPPA